MDAPKSDQISRYFYHILLSILRKFYAYQYEVLCVVAHETIAWIFDRNMSICRVFLQCAPVCAGPIDDLMKMFLNIVDIGEVSHHAHSLNYPTLPHQTHPYHSPSWSLPCHHGVLLRLRPRDLQNAWPRFWSSGTEITNKIFIHFLNMNLSDDQVILYFYIFLHY